VPIDPDHAIAYSNRGKLYRQKGQYDRAIANYSKALELHPNLDNAYFGRGLTYKATGEYSKALDDMNSAKALGEDQVTPALLDELRKATPASKPSVQKVTPENSQEIARLVARLKQNYHRDKPEFHWSDGSVFDDGYIRKGHALSLEKDFTLLTRYFECSIPESFWRFGDNERIPADYHMSENSAEDCDKNRPGLRWEEKQASIPLAQIKPASIHCRRTSACPLAMRTTRMRLGTCSARIVRRVSRWQQTCEDWLK
jgi:tetratricopeptide (TPR) repeat protein